MSAAEMKLELVRRFTEECWRTLHTVKEVHDAIDQFIEQMGCTL